MNEPEEQDSIFEKTHNLAHDQTPRSVPKLWAKEFAPLSSEPAGGLQEAVGVSQRSISLAIDRYEMLEPLGFDAFGAVFLAEDKQSHARVAVQVSAGPAKDSGWERRFLSEAARIKALNHPEIVNVCDFGVDSDRCYLVSEFLEGMHLERWLENHRPTCPQALQIVTLLADALSYVHERGIIHGHIKAANIRLVGRGKVAQPLLVGFAPVTSESVTPYSQNSAAALPSYLAPEQALRRKDIDGRADVYALGVLLYRLLSGQLPFRATQIGELLQQISEDAPQPPRQLAQSVSPELERICLRAMAKNPDSRYATAKDFAADLRAILGEFAEEVTTIPIVQDEGCSSDGLETREVQILLCRSDLSAAPELRNDLNAEQRQSLWEVHVQNWRDVAASVQGSSVQAHGDELLFCFDDSADSDQAARRAVRAGLAMLHGTSRLVVHQLRETHGLDVCVWLGIYTANAEIRRTEDLPDGPPWRLVNQPTELTTRFEGMASSQPLLVTNKTGSLIGRHYRMEPAELTESVSKSTAHATYSVAVEDGAQYHIEIAEPLDPLPLIGRDTQVAMLRDRWQQAQEGMGQVVLVIGEAGSGKSRVVAAIGEHVAQHAGASRNESRAPTVVTWNCLPRLQPNNLRPAIVALANFFEFQDSDTGLARLEKLVDRIETASGADAEITNTFAALLELPATQRFPLLNLTPMKLKESALEALLGWLRKLAMRRSVLFVVEDLQWVDPATLELLNLLLDQGLSEHMLTVLTFRPEFETPWGSRSHQTQVALNRLTKRRVSEMVSQLTGLAEISAEAIADVSEQTGGVPGRIEDFVALAEDAGLWGSDSQFSPNTVPPIDAMVSDSVEAVLHRLSRRGIAPAITQSAAVLGRAFHYESIRLISSCDEPTLQTELGKLVQNRLLWQRGTPPQCSYVFRHARARNALLESLTAEMRAEICQKIGDA